MFLAVAALALQAATCPSAAPGAALEAPTPLTTPSLETPLLALRAFGEELLSLSPRGLSLYVRSADELRLLTQRPVPTTGPPTRRAGGLLWSEPGSRTAWALATGWSQARLLDLDGDLAVRTEADAIPWPGAASGVRLRPGTDLLEATLRSLGDGPFLALSEDGRSALDADSRLRVGAGESALRLGPPLASVWPGWMLAATPAPPGGPDAVLLVELDPEPRVRARCPLEGSLRAIAVETLDARTARAVLAIEDADGRWRLSQSRVRVRRDP